MALSSASSASAALRIFAGLELSWAQLEDAASLDVRERALQRSDRRRCIRPPILIRDDVGGVEAYAAVLNPDFKLAPLSDPQLPAHVDRQSQTALLVYRDDAACHPYSLFDEVSLRQYGVHGGSRLAVTMAP